MRRSRIPEAVITAAATTAGLLALSGCATDAAAPDTPPPSAASTPSPDPSATAAAAAAADEELLPLPVEEIADWAENAVPSSDTEGHAISYSGWLSEHTSQHLTNTDQTVPAGSYQVQIACRGDGTITVSTRPVTAASSDDGITCQNATIAFDASTSTPGLVTELTLEGAPTLYALSFVRSPAP